MGRQIDLEKHRPTDREADRQTKNPTDRQTDICNKYRQADRQALLKSLPDREGEQQQQGQAHLRQFGG